MAKSCVGALEVAADDALSLPLLAENSSYMTIKAITVQLMSSARLHDLELHTNLFR